METSQGGEEFEFQMCKTSLEKDAVAPSPADELFYKGKLLPLHLPPRLQMVQNLLQNSISPSFTEESCSVSPTDSCRASCELNPDEYFFQWSKGVSGCDADDTHLSKKPWSKKMKLGISQKLKSFFTRSAAAGVGGEEAGNVSRAKEYVNKYIKIVKKNSFGQMESESVDDQIGFTCHRLSFSGAIKRHSTSSTKTTASSNASSNCSCSDSSFSVKSTNGFYEINLLNKGVNVNLEDENSIEGAIAHCKKSQQKQECSEEKRLQTEVQTCLLSASRSEN